jgi:phosphoribosyl-AMP cyclohydrolase / phosphoribosyl-ATP pyrophosphohydrolase
VLIPCIDLQRGQAVQLVQGRKRELAVADVLGLLDRFSRYEWLHVIDLDAAMRKGHNNELVRQLCLEARRKYKMKVRVGGGIRTIRRAQALKKLGVQQIIIGSAAFRNGSPNLTFLKTLATKIGKKHVLIALDTAKGRIVTHGWRSALSVEPRDVFELIELYCAGFLCTDVDREGTMTGANLKWFRALRASTKLPIVAAGGISTTREIRALEKIGMDSAVGMALYKNRVA